MVSMYGGHTTCKRANKLNSVKASTQDGPALESLMTLTRLLAISIFTFKENGGEK